ncbi:MmgE/PrpD family protein [Pseudomonas fluorescens]|uniref:MmgE/PrpD family protein n=1 Tax=Pseudomonas fluorescens TaxID=294 RepID=A0A944HLP0_PSEFL|nr:MmgE/PrpD family protein [Pseudomonas fluorescens]MBT2295333.1 MmgE/PrpD family protein [Pseudomonas fluorescens]MBT2308987.1 MmgE/PrpD family protein [Pseudomonas fluorescens]MBT2312260.1 MmgE/PrpD family protein [Pseudomonas fluorescens]MBT2318173.1 MmgE/PrpD family protein [Pseudomonas fluorescens]MBT2332008.1 MmgE/PrpD family protein [Pseudomonas fluorescens]
MTNPIQVLAEAAASWQRRDLSEEVTWATRRAILDWFATTLPGCVLPPATLLAGAFSPWRGPGNAICYVDGQLCSPRHAALLNASASHTVEFDDIFKDGGYHPGSPTVSAALAVAQDRGASLEQLHRAIIAGYEVGCRISLAIQPSHYDYWHTTSTVGTMGAAVATAMILGADAQRIAHAIALSSSFAGGHQQNLQGEGMAKALHPGHAADAGILAGVAATNGVTASLDSLHGDKGFAAATSTSSGDWITAFEGLGEWTPISRMTVKNHGCCGHVFPALDGLRLLQEREYFAAADIDSIHVTGYGATYQMCNRTNPRSAQEARFSLQYCMAAQSVLGGVRLAAFAPDALVHPDIQALMQKVTVTEDAELAAAYPKKRMAKLLVRLKDGRQINHFQETRKGDPEDPLSDEELVAKYDELAGSVLSQQQLIALRQTILYGDVLPGIIRAYT